MSDELRTLFERFEADSLALTRPPGALAVQRTVRRRYATRAALALAAAIVVILTALLPHALTPRSNEPIGPPPTAPFSFGAAPTGTLAPSPTTTSPSPSPSAHPSPSPTATTPSLNACVPGNDAYFGLTLSNPSPDVYALDQGALGTCPNLTVPLTRAVYRAPGATNNTLTRSSSTSVTLTPANRSATLSSTLPAPSCASVLIVVYEGTLSPPATMPNYAPRMVSTGTEDDLDNYFASRGAHVYTASAQSPAC